MSDSENQQGSTNNSQGGRFPSSGKPLLCSSLIVALCVTRTSNRYEHTPNVITGRIIQLLINESKLARRMGHMYIANHKSNAGWLTNYFTAIMASHIFTRRNPWTIFQRITIHDSHTHARSTHPGRAISASGDVQHNLLYEISSHGRSIHGITIYYTIFHLMKGLLDHEPKTIGSSLRPNIYRCEYMVPFLNNTVIHYHHYQERLLSTITITDEKSLQITTCQERYCITVPYEH